MALKYEIKTFEAEIISGNPTGKTRVGFTVTDDSDNQKYLIDKTIETGSKSDDTITDEAYEACQTQVNDWVNSKKNVGKTFDPSSKKIT
mgnify:CR=1 FL=1